MNRACTAVAIGLCALGVVGNFARADSTHPTNAVAALDRANAAYEFGDLNQVVDVARLVVDGALPATEPQRIQALRLLGIGLSLTGRPSGAEKTFFELLRLSPQARLDPKTTRPEVVAFFEDVRRRRNAELAIARAQDSRQHMWRNFLPPLGQFKNGNDARGWAFLTLQTAALATAVTTRVMLGASARGDKTHPDPDRAQTLKTINYASVGALAAVYVAGVLDGFWGAPDDEETAETAASWSLAPTPTGAAFIRTF